MTDRQPGVGPEEGRTFENIVEELETVTEQLASGAIGIEAAADLYERAERLHAAARARLDAVQARVDRLASRSADLPMPDGSTDQAAVPGGRTPGAVG